MKTAFAVILLICCISILVISEPARSQGSPCTEGNIQVAQGSRDYLRRICDPQTGNICYLRVGSNYDIATLSCVRP